MFLNIINNFGYKIAIFYAEFLPVLYRYPHLLKKALPMRQKKKKKNPQAMHKIHRIL